MFEKGQRKGILFPRRYIGGMDFRANVNKVNPFYPNASHEEA